MELEEIKPDLTGTAPPLKPKNYLKTTLWVLAVIVLAIIYNWSFCAVQFDAERLVDGLPRMIGFLQEAFPPDWDVLQKVWEETVLTIQIALISTTFAAIIALPLSFIQAKRLAQTGMRSRSFRPDRMPRRGRRKRPRPSYPLWHKNHGRRQFGDAAGAGA